MSDKIIAMWNQADVEATVGYASIYAELKREEDNEMRAAVNFYSRQLTHLPMNIFVNCSQGEEGRR